MKVSQKEKLHCTALPGGPTGNILIAKLDWIERIGAPRRSVGLRMWSNRCKFHHANQPWRVERKGGQEAGEKEVIRPSRSFRPPSIQTFLSLPGRNQVVWFHGPRFRMCVRYVLHSTSLPPTPRQGRGGRLAQKRARLKAEGCRLPNRCLDPVENRARSEIPGFHP